MYDQERIAGRRKRRGKAPLAVALAVALAAIVVPSSASAAWTSARDISLSGNEALTPVVAVASDGDAVLAWEQHDAFGHYVAARTMTETGVLGPIKVLSLLD